MNAALPSTVGRFESMRQNMKTTINMGILKRAHTDDVKALSPFFIFKCLALPHPAQNLSSRATFE
ncbi:hypothetical protein A8A54_20380 [Brucella pseudogrignonensis]|nr:hypothetical protein A8A54_20380 [Brucella pseudogrignonensis]